MKLETLLFPVLLSVATGCADTRNSIILPNQSDAFTSNRITRMIDRQKLGHYYGSRFSPSGNPNEYHDGFEYDGHIFATTISEQDGNVVLTFYGDNIQVTDIFGDGRIDSAHVFNGRYDLKKGHAGHDWIRKESPDNFQLQIFEDALLDIIEEKYATGTISAGSITQFLLAKNGILYRS